MSNEPRRGAASITAVNTLAFALSFAAWVALGPSTRAIASELHLTSGAAALLKGAPILVGAAMRLPVGVLTDRLGARLTFALVQLVAAVGAMIVATAHSLAVMMVGALTLGLVGTTFVVGAQSVSAWTPPDRRGLALGVFGTGNVGAALTTFALPIVIASHGFRAGLRLYAVILVACAATYVALVRDAPMPRRRFADLVAPLFTARAWALGLFYAATFGAFVATTLLASDLYLDVYRVDVRTAGALTTTFTFGASVLRVLGGKLSDRFGATPVMRVSLLVIAASLAPVTFAPPLAVAAVCIFVAGVAMGIGASAPLKYVAVEFPSTVGAVSGVVGAIGGLAGFVLPMLSAAVKGATRSASWALAPVIALAFVAGVLHALPTQGAGGGTGALAPSIPPPR